MDGLGRAVVGVWRAHTVLDESDGAESSPEVPDRFRKMRSSSSLGSLRMSLRKRLPLRSVQTNSLPETSTSEVQKEQPKPNAARKLSRTARNSITEMCQVSTGIRDLSVCPPLYAIQLSRGHGSKCLCFIGSEVSKNQRVFPWGLFGGHSWSGYRDCRCIVLHSPAYSSSSSNAQTHP